MRKQGSFLIYNGLSLLRHRQHTLSCQNANEHGKSDVHVNANTTKNAHSHTNDESQWVMQVQNTRHTFRHESARERESGQNKFTKWTDVDVDVKCIPNCMHI